MVKSMFAAVSGLRSHQSRMDVIGNNIANVNTWGYKARSANFRDEMYQNTTTGAGGNTAAGGTGGRNTSQLGFGVNVGSITTNFTTGSRNPTGIGLDCMVNGTGFFIVGPMRTAGIPNDQIAAQGLSLSRVGMLKPDNNGYIVDDQGNYVYGYAYDEAGKTMLTDVLVPLRIPDNGATPPVRLKIASFKIEADGKMVGTDNDGVPHVLGQIAVASVENPAGLEQGSGYLYKVGTNAGVVLGMPTTAATGEILSGCLEMSNVELAKEMSEMITTQRGFQANSKIITVTDEMLEQLVNIKR